MGFRFLVFRVKVSQAGLGFVGLRLRVSGFRFRVSGFRFRVFRVWV